MAEDIQETTSILELHTNARKTKCIKKPLYQDLQKCGLIEIANIFGFANLVKKNILPTTQISKILFVQSGNKLVK